MLVGKLLTPPGPTPKPTAAAVAVVAAPAIASGVRRLPAVGVSVPDGCRLSFGESGGGCIEESLLDSAISCAIPLPRRTGGRGITSGAIGGVVFVSSIR